jgi:hypothetical protein
MTQKHIYTYNSVAETAAYNIIYKIQTIDS